MLLKKTWGCQVLDGFQAAGSNSRPVLTASSEESIFWYVGAEAWPAKYYNTYVSSLIDRNGMWTEVCKHLLKLIQGLSWLYSDWGVSEIWVTGYVSKIKPSSVDECKSTMWSLPSIFRLCVSFMYVNNTQFYQHRLLNKVYLILHLFIDINNSSTSTTTNYYYFQVLSLLLSLSSSTKSSLVAKVSLLLQSSSSL